jgi:hypothetical protein
MAAATVTSSTVKARRRISSLNRRALGVPKSIALISLTHGIDQMNKRNEH